MSSNPYTTPTADLRHDDEDDVIASGLHSHKGRLSVLTYLSHSFILGIIAEALSALIYLPLGGSSIAESGLNESSTLPLIVGLIEGIILLIAFYLSVIMMIKRFHDRNLSGWWVLTIFILIGFVILLIPGKKTPNRFGGFRAPVTWEKILGFLTIAIYLSALLFGIYYATVGGAFS